MGDSGIVDNNRCFVFGSIDEKFKDVEEFSSISTTKSQECFCFFDFKLALFE